MITRIGFQSFPIDRVIIEFTDEDVWVLEWLRGRTYTIPPLAAGRMPPEDMIHESNTITEKMVRYFLQRLWDCTGHMRCCADLSPKPKK